MVGKSVAWNFSVGSASISTVATGGPLGSTNAASASPPPCLSSLAPSVVSPAAPTMPEQDSHDDCESRRC